MFHHYGTVLYSLVTAAVMLASCSTDLMYAWSPLPYPLCCASKQDLAVWHIKYLQRTGIHHPACNVTTSTVNLFHSNNGT